MSNFTQILSEKNMDRVHELLTGGFGKLSVVVAGDLMLDRYISGAVSRISPEAPVPVVQFHREHLVAGGAGNVAANFVGLGMPVRLLGRVGTDSDGRELLSLPFFKSIDVSGIVTNGQTTVKTRIMGAGRQQMLRLDHEEVREPDAGEIAAALLKIKEAVADGAKLVVLSDYGKGFCSPSFCRQVLSLAGALSFQVWVDPKKNNWESYRGASMITPNIKELSAASGRDVANEDDEVAAAAKELIARYGIASMLVTRSERGATLVGSHGVTHIPVGAVEVYDASGAGDTMIAAAAAFSAAGLPMIESVALANAASQIVIGKIGTYPIKAYELLSAICEDNRKLVTAGEAEERCRLWRANGEKIIFTNGCFDILHVGHIDSLTAAKALGNRLVVGLNSDASVRRLKGDPRPVNDATARAKVLSALEAVDAVVVFEEDTPAQLLSRLRPDVIAKGGDYRPEDVAGAEYVGEVVIIPLTNGYSTTSILEKIARTK